VAFAIGAEERPGNHVSVILGRNGQGKSRLLAAVASAFQLLGEGRSNVSEQRSPLASLNYLINGHNQLIRFVAGRAPVLLVDGVEADVQKIELPSKVIALSMTPFDKFPLEGGGRLEESRRPSGHFDIDSSDNLYSYIGMRDRVGRSSVSALIFRAVEGLFSRKDARDRSRVAKVFDLVGYRTQIAVVFRIYSSHALREISEGGDPLRNSRLIPSSRIFGIRKLFQVDEGSREKLRHASVEVLRLAQKGIVIVQMDVQAPSTSALQLFSALQFLRSVGLVSVSAFELQKLDGELIDLKQASSGELSIAITFLSLASLLQDNSLVLIDEPETSLHPEWQSKYLDLLLSTFSGYSGCHFVLATHSPLILADAPFGATLASVSDKVPEKGEEVAGRPADYLLAKAFQTVSGSNLYVQQEVIKALRLAADGKSQTVEFKNIIGELAQLKTLIHDNPGMVQLISELEGVSSRGSVNRDA
jgi:predicted ATPase